MCDYRLQNVKSRPRKDWRQDDDRSFRLCHNRLFRSGRHDRCGLRYSQETSVVSQMKLADQVYGRGIRTSRITKSRSSDVASFRERSFRSQMKLDDQVYGRGIRTSPITKPNFRQINQDDPRTHHDALELPDGRIVLLTFLKEGQQATVLQLPAAAVGVKPPHEWPRQPLNSAQKEKVPTPQPGLKVSQHGRIGRITNSNSNAIAFDQLRRVCCVLLYKGHTGQPADRHVTDVIAPRNLDQGLALGKPSSGLCLLVLGELGLPSKPHTP